MPPEDLEMIVTKRVISAKRLFGLPSDLGFLNDVDTTGVLDGYIIYYNESTEKWLVKALKLEDMTDVELTDIADGRIIYWDSGDTKFKFRDEIVTLADLTDTDLTGLANGQILAYNGFTLKWEPVFLTTLPHKSSHELGGADELDVTGLSGVLATPQTPATHASTHEPGGADEINITATASDENLVIAYQVFS